LVTVVSISIEEDSSIFMKNSIKIFILKINSNKFKADCKEENMNEIKSSCFYKGIIYGSTFKV
jgi:hypothetical protein